MPEMKEHFDLIKAEMDGIAEKAKQSSSFVVQVMSIRTLGQLADTIKLEEQLHRLTSEETVILMKYIKNSAHSISSEFRNKLKVTT